MVCEFEFIRRKRREARCANELFADPAQKFQAFEPAGFRTAAAEAPPKAGKVGFVGGRRSVLALGGRQIREPRQEEKIARDRTRGMLRIQKGDERRIGFAEKRRFRIRQKIDAHRSEGGLPHFVGQIGAPFLVAGPDGKDGAPSGRFQNAAQQVAQRQQGGGVRELVDVIDEQRRAPAASQLVQQFVALHRTPEGVRHLRPSASDDTTRSEDDHRAFRALPPGQRLEYVGFADARCAGDVNDARLFERLLGAVDQFGPRQARATDAAPNIGQRVFRRLREARINRPEIGMQSRKPYVCVSF